MIEATLQKYSQDIKNAAWLYIGLWPGRGKYDVNDLMQAARMAVWNVSERYPEKLNHKSYVRAAMRYAIFKEIRKSASKIKEIHLVREYGDEIPVVDLLGVYNEDIKRLTELDELSHHIRDIFPNGDEYSDNLMRLVERCGDIYDLNLSEPPKTELKDRTKIVTRLDLIDDDMVMWANVLIGSINKFPRNYLAGNFERARKYIRKLVLLINSTPQRFALSGDKIETLIKYRLWRVYKSVYNHDITSLLNDVFSLEYSREQVKKIRYSPSLIKAVSDAIRALRIKTGKELKDIGTNDFEEYSLMYILNHLFGGSAERAVEFRFPGTHPEFSEEMGKLRESLTNQSRI